LVAENLAGGHLLLLSDPAARELLPFGSKLVAIIMVGLQINNDETV